MLKVDNKETDANKVTDVFIVNLEHVSHLVLMFILLTLKM